MLLLCLYAQTSAAALNLSEEEKAWIRANPVITVANELDWPPFDYVDNGKPAGYSIDIVRLIKQKTGLKVKFINGYTWAELMEQFKAGKIDVMPAIYINEERRQYTEFTRSYFSQPSVMVVNVNNKEITGLESLRGKRVAGIRGFAITSTLKELVPGIKILEYGSLVDAMKAVSIGEAEAFIDSLGTISYHLDHNYIPNLKIIGKFDNNALANPALYFGVAKGRRILLSILDKGLAAISREEKKTLERRWIYLPEAIKKVDVSNKIILTPEQQAWLSERPVIRIGIDADYAPYSFQDSEARFIGIAPDFLKLISDRLGVTFEPVHGLNWAEILQATREHKLDMIATAVETPERKSFLGFTQIYIPTPLVIMSRDDDSRIGGPNDLSGMTVALVKAYSSSKRVIDEHPDIKVLNVSSPTEGLHAVSSGKADAYIGVVGVNIHVAQQQGISNLKIAADYDVTGNGQRFAVRSDWPVLVQILQRALDSISEQERKLIYDKWVKVPHIQQIDYSLLWKVLLVFLIIVGLMFYHNHQLRREVSRRKLVEHRLLDMNENLIAAKNEAIRANQAKSDFLSCMSHELRTPMHAILGFSQMLENELADDKQKQSAHDIHSAGSHLLELINDVLDLSRIESGKLDLHMTEVDLSQVVHESCSLVQTLAEKYQVNLEENITCVADRILHADYTRLTQVMLNLMSNAIKYNKPGGTVSVDCEEIPDQLVRISVTDTGKGLSEEQQRILFRPFERAGAEDMAIEGTGIGLAITKHLVDGMGGRIGFTSESGKGSSFWVDFPLVGSRQIADRRA